jgi:tRNA(Ile)-lysidine synthetase-like protein
LGINHIPGLGYINFTEVCINQNNTVKNENNIINISVFSECVIRSRKTGDFITLPKKPGSRSLKKLFIDNKIPRENRALLPVLATNDNKVIWVYKFGTDKEYMPFKSRSPSIDDKYIKIETNLII